ncbi:FkbM family methyltransferase [Pseudomonas dryadis]|uniref:FkbM family methyltransferase n=2 Tax=Pseudomonadales TaxID=72274 RepID=A0A4Q9R361_9GAMM|nr:FkbM family methyltransferase [Pseudomonas dryadis]TBV07992.1 FkbM family methyltransferase [Pseudomonas dryadis]TBV19387.1 FkbM family methyltransferase [Pseudomonas sp. FRB 230]
MGDVFLAAANALASDPMFGVPRDVRDVLARHGAATRVVILGTNGFGSHLMSVKGERNGEVIAAVDDFRYHSGALYYGLPIISTDKFLELARQQGDLVAVNTCRYDRPKRFFDSICRAHGIPHLNFEQTVRAFRLQGRVDYRVDDWGPEIIRNIPALQALAGRMADDYSVRTLHAVLNFHLACEPEYYHEVERPYSTLYFRSGLLQFSDAESMVDCGASIGESLAGLVGVTKGRFERSWMIEPDRINQQTLQNVLRRYEGTPLASRITLHDCGVGETSCQVPFNHEGGHGGFVRPADDTYDVADLIEVRPIDEIIDDVPTFIKMDIEGYELAALKGARKTISEHAPKLAISAYHRSTDLLDLTGYVLALNPDYKVGLRHHTPDRWDTCLYFY